MNINPQTSEAYKLLHNGTLAFARAELQGIRIDTDYCERKKLGLTRKIERLENELYESDFYKHWAHTTKGKPNIYSNTQLSNFLYNIKKIDPIFTTRSGQGATDEDALTQLNIAELNSILSIRKLKKIRDTYLDAFIREQVNGYIHPSFNLHVVTTYRSSSSNPNFQNIPKRDKEAMNICRGALFPRPGHLLMELDFSGLEVRIATCFHNDPTMIKYIKDPSTDMHRDMACQLFMINDFDPNKTGHKYLRGASKNGFVFPQFYGSWYKSCATYLAYEWGKLPREKRWKKGQGIPFEDSFLSDHLIDNGIRSLDQFIEHVRIIEDDFWNNRFPIYTKWKEKFFHQYRKCGYVDLKTGFRCQGIMDKKEVINYPIQGSAFHCNLWSLIRLDQILFTRNYDTKIIGQIHDSIVLDVHPDELNKITKLARKITCQDLPKEWDWINVPLDIEIDAGEVDQSWAMMKKLEEV